MGPVLIDPRTILFYLERLPPGADFFYKSTSSVSPRIIIAEGIGLIDPLKHIYYGHMLLWYLL